MDCCWQRSPTGRTTCLPRWRNSAGYALASAQAKPATWLAAAVPAVAVASGIGAVYGHAGDLWLIHGALDTRQPYSRGGEEAVEAVEKKAVAWRSARFVAICKPLNVASTRGSDSAARLPRNTHPTRLCERETRDTAFAHDRSAHETSVCQLGGRPASSSGHRPHPKGPRGSGTACRCVRRARNIFNRFGRPGMPAQSQPYTVIRPPPSHWPSAADEEPGGPPTHSHARSIPAPGAQRAR